MFSTANNKPSYTPVTVGTMSLNSKNGSPKINYFSPSPPASPSIKTPDYPAQVIGNSKNNVSSSVNKISDLISNMKPNLESKNLEIFDYFWFQKDVFILCIYNNIVPVCIYFQNENDFEETILTQKEECEENYIIDLIQLQENENIFERSSTGVCIKINNSKSYYEFINVPEDNDIRHSVIPLLFINDIENLIELQIDKKYEQILNITLKSTTNNLENIKNILQDSLSVNKFHLFTSELFGNIEQIVKKILSLKKSKKTVLDNIEYYKINKINVPQNDIENLYIINSKLINYYAYYEKYLSFIIYTKKIIDTLSQANKYFEIMNKNILS